VFSDSGLLLFHTLFLYSYFFLLYLHLLMKDFEARY